MIIVRDDNKYMVEEVQPAALFAFYKLCCDIAYEGGTDMRLTLL